MIGRDDIEGSKSNVAMNTWLPQASYPYGNFSDTSSFEFRRSKGSLGHAFTVHIRTGNMNHTSFYPSVPHEISVLVELILGRLHYLLTDAPPQPKSPPDNVSAQFGTVTRLSVHPASPVLLTKNGPLGALDFVARLNQEAASSYLFKFENRSRTLRPQDERFARQYHCGPPPEFPLASPRSGIVHHLSDPDREPTGQRPKRVDAEARRRRALPATIEEMAFHECIESPGFGRPLIHAGPCPESIGGLARRRSTSDRGASPTPISFPPDNFKHSLTLFSKSFSSFPRGICSLSVSRPYLALDGIHRPIWAVFPNNSTRRQCLVVIPPDLGSRSECLSAKGTWSPNVRQAIAAMAKSVEFQPPVAAMSADVDSHLGRP
ncbi:Protein TAR1 [Capsicum baccatum]|uniref:Protein TAR1 n=1 Tax=Capsicum baccatum TaxID=33114 RepID=A0A2G2WH06_CAPBA|nr:Protein TAR1 [Capsicum baccatum]